MDNSDVIHTCIDLENYYNYYNLEDLLKQLKINDLEQIDNPEQLFRSAVEHGIEELAEYLYIFHGIQFELNEITSWFDMPLSIEETFRSTSTKLNNTCISGEIDGAACGLRMNIVDSKVIRGKRVLDRLLKLRKYSKYTSSNKKFYYSFNADRTYSYFSSIM